MKIIAALWIAVIGLACAEDDPSYEFPPLALPYSFDINELANCTQTQMFHSEDENCHSSWLTAAVVSISLRRCYQFQDNIPSLSISYAKACIPAGSCNGGLTKLAWEGYLNKSGIPDNTTYPYYNKVSNCPSNSVTELYHISTFRNYRGIPAIQMAILQGGPVQACFRVYQDFQDYQGGVYVYNWGAFLEYACFVLTGWNGNAWNGYNFWYGSIPEVFSIQMGQCDIENDVWGGVPIFPPS